MDTHHFTGFYEGWRKSRFFGTLKYINKNFFLNKTLLEVGCGCGDNGKLFKDIGCIVNSSDARDELVTIGKMRYPEIEFTIFDCDNDKLQNKYDIILDWGILYHLDKVEEHLNDMCNNCTYLLLESEVCDSFDNITLKVNENTHYDQSYHRLGSRPSPSLIEYYLEKNNFEFKLIKDECLNYDFHIYNWEIQNTNTWKDGLRRFWICWKKGFKSPLE